MKLAVILLLCAVPAFLRPDQTPPTVVQTAIALDLVIDYDVPQIIGAGALTIENGGDVPVADVPLQIGRLMTVSATVTAPAPHYLGAYFRAYRSSGSTTDQFVEFVTDRAPATSSVFRDWLYTVGWYEALRNGRKLSEVWRDTGRPTLRAERRAPGRLRFAIR